MMETQVAKKKTDFFFLKKNAVAKSNANAMSAAHHNTCVERAKITL